MKKILDTLCLWQGGCSVAVFDWVSVLKADSELRLGQREAPLGRRRGAGQS